MKNYSLRFTAIITSVLLLATLLHATVEPIPSFMGDWQGGWVDASKKDGNAKNNPGLVARVIGLGDNRFEIQMFEEFDKRAAYLVKTEATLKNGKLRFEDGGFAGEISDSSFIGKKTMKDLVTGFSLKRVYRQSPTMGLRAPADAVVLFGGEDMNAWVHGEGNPATWTVKDGIVEILPKGDDNEKGGSINTRQEFGDIKVHLEFNLPYEPAGRGQGRGNSGFFVPGGYEVQILDSYGLGGLWNECGALYKQMPPQVNMCFAPGVWQTYDIEFTQPRFDSHGNKLSDAVITVLHNGKLIHNQVALKGTTSNTQMGRLKSEKDGRGSLSLQDHKHKLQFRNIWVQER